MNVLEVDFPASLTRWSAQTLQEDVLRVPSCDDFLALESGKGVLLFNGDDTASGLSLDQTPSDVSSSLGMDDMGVDFDVFSDASVPQSPLSSAPRPCSPSPAPSLLASLPCLSSHFNLKLDYAGVAAAWQNQRNGKLMSARPRNRIASAAGKNIASEASLAPYSAADCRLVPAVPMAMACPGPVNGISAHPPPRLMAPKGPKQMRPKRPRTGGRHDKRPRYKGRFVTREELQRLLAEDERMAAEAQGVKEAANLQCVPSVMRSDSGASACYEMHAVPSMLVPC